jgi:hypothetical protein
MRWRWSAAIVAVLGAPRLAAAQGGSIDMQCVRPGASLAAQDACQKAIDIFQFMAPQLGLSVAGGSAVLGESGSLGGFPRVSLGARGNFVAGLLPRATEITPVLTGAVRSDYRTARQAVGLPALDVAVGVFRGFELPGTRGLAFDLLVNVGWIPRTSNDYFDVSVPDGSLRLGLGGRLVILEESLLTPSITASFLRRDLPTIELVATPGNDELAVRDLSVETSQWRLILGKQLGPFVVTAGGGQDHYDSGASISARVEGIAQSFAAGPVSVRQSLRRDNAFIGAAVNVALLRLAAELGRANGGTIATFNTFGGKRADDALVYGSLGVRARW